LAGREIAENLFQFTFSKLVNGAAPGDGVDQEDPVLVSLVDDNIRKLPKVFRGKPQALPKLAWILAGICLTSSLPHFHS